MIREITIYMKFQTSHLALYSRWFIIVARGFKKAYNPPPITSAETFMVIEGVINPPSDSTIFKISHRVKTDGNLISKPLVCAIVKVESEQNKSYPITERSVGSYALSSFDAEETRQYRIRTKLPDESEYLYDFGQIIVTRPIGSIVFTAENHLAYYDKHNASDVCFLKINKRKSSMHQARINIYFWLIIGAFSVTGCRKVFDPPAIASPGTYLVVEGVINIGSDSTVIRLSHTVSIASKTTANPVPDAVITVESDQNISYPLSEITPGRYVSVGLNLNSTRTYRLHIKTPDNKEYLSDFVEAKVTPAIDTVAYTTNNNAMQLTSSTHDSKNNTHYYRFDYAETWLFHAEYFSAFVSNGTELLARPVDQLIYTCWASNNSSTILLASSAKLAQDVIYQNPLTSVVSSSEKIEAKYSIVVREYALTSAAYLFWQNLKKNTENLGSIFDAQPSQINGNIHNVANSNEPVIGYVSASTISSKRIFITRDQLPNTWTTTYPFGCQLDSDYWFVAVGYIVNVAINL